MTRRAPRGESAIPEPFAARILTPSSRVLDTQATYLRVPAWDGLLGVMSRHAPLLARLTVGAIRVTEANGDERHFAIAGGTLRVADGEALVLAEAAEEADEIDVDRARQALERAQHRLSVGGRGEVDVSRAELALARAANRLRVAGDSGG